MQSSAVGRFAKYRTDLARSVPRSRRGFRNNSVRYTTHVIPSGSVRVPFPHVHSYIPFHLHHLHIPTHTLGQSYWVLGLTQGIPGPLPPQTWHVPFRIMQRLHLVWSYRTHLVTVFLEGAYRLPVFLWEVNPTFALGPNTFHKLHLNVPYLPLYLCLLLFYLM